MTIYQNNAYKHGIGWSIWHMEWCTKYRHKVFLDSELQKLCALAFAEAARRNRLRIEEYEIQADHVHLLVYLRPSMSPSMAVGLIKGFSSHFIFSVAEDKLKRYYWNPKGKRSLWSDGKFFAKIKFATK